MKAIITNYNSPYFPIWEIHVEGILYLQPDGQHHLFVSIMGMCKGILGRGNGNQGKVRRAWRED